MSIKSKFQGLKRKIMMPLMTASTAVVLAVPTFAADPVSSDGVIDATAFDPMVSGITGNVGAVLPKVIVVLGLLVGIGVVIGLVRKHAKA